MIVIGVTGGIAAYKMCSVVSYLTSENHDVHVVMTESAKKFVSPMTFAALSHNPVIDDNTEWEPNGEIDHILYSKATLLVIAPATANTIAKIAHGMADNVLTSLALAFTGKIFIFPAMNVNMYENEITQKNMATLLAIKFKELKDIEWPEEMPEESKIHRSSKYEIIVPVEGRLACGDVGRGKLPPTREIINKIKRYAV